MKLLGILFGCLWCMIAPWHSASAEEQLTYDLTDLEPGLLCGYWDMHHWVSFTTEALDINNCGGGGGGCFATVDGDGLTLLLTQMRIEPFAMLIWGITRVEVDIVERDAALTATLRSWPAGQVQSESAGPITLVIESAGDAVLSCCHCTVSEVRLFGDDIVPTAGGSWGVLKSWYR